MYHTNTAVTKKAKKHISQAGNQIPLLSFRSAASSLAKEEERVGGRRRRRRRGASNLLSFLLLLLSPGGRLRLQRQRRRRGSPSSPLLLSRAVGAIMEGEKECRTEGLRRRLLHPHSLSFPNHSLVVVAAAFLLSLRLFPRLPKEGDYRSPKKINHQCCFNLDNSRFVLLCYCAFGHCESLSNLLPRRLRLDKLPSSSASPPPPPNERPTDRAATTNLASFPPSLWHYLSSPPPPFS